MTTRATSGTSVHAPRARATAVLAAAISVLLAPAASAAQAPPREVIEQAAATALAPRSAAVMACAPQTAALELDVRFGADGQVSAVNLGPRASSALTLCVGGALAGARLPGAVQDGTTVRHIFRAAVPPTPAAPPQQPVFTPVPPVPAQPAPPPVRPTPAPQVQPPTPQPARPPPAPQVQQPPPATHVQPPPPVPQVQPPPSAPHVQPPPPVPQVQPPPAPLVQAPPQPARPAPAPTAPVVQAPAARPLPPPRIVLPVVVVALPDRLVTPAASAAIRDAIVAGLAPAAGGRPVVALPDEARIAAIASCHDPICFGARLAELQAMTGVLVYATRRNRISAIQVRIEVLDPVSGASRIAAPIVVPIPATAEAAPAPLLAAAIAQLVPAMPSPPPPSPTLLVVTNVDDATVTIDGRDAGRSPLAPIELPPGRYNVVVSARGWASGNRMVQLGDTGPTRADFDLEPATQTLTALESGRSWSGSDGSAAPGGDYTSGEATPFYLNPWVIAGTAAAVVAAIVVIAVVASSGGTEVGPPAGIPIPPITSP